MERGAHVFAVDLDPQMNLTTFYVVNGGDLPVNNINDLLPVHDDSIHSDGPGIPVGSKVLAQQRKVLLTEMGTEGFSANYPYAAQTAVRLYHHRHELSDQSADDQCSYRCGR